MKDKTDISDKVRRIQVAGYLDNIQFLRFEAQRLRIKPSPTRSTLLQHIVLEWIEKKEKEAVK